MSGRFLLVPAFNHGPAWSEDRGAVIHGPGCVLHSMNALSVRDHSGRSSRSVWGDCVCGRGWEEGRVQRGRQDIWVAPEEPVGTSAGRMDRVLIPREESRAWEGNINKFLMRSGGPEAQKKLLLGLDHRVTR